MDNRNDILYFASSFGIICFASTMELIGLVEFRDFSGVEATFERKFRKIEHMIYDDKPQLLITSWLILELTLPLAVEHINRLHIKNPQLMVVNQFSKQFTGEKCFSREIDITLPGSIQELLNVIQDFRSGKFRRIVE